MTGEIVNKYKMLYRNDRVQGRLITCFYVNNYDAF